MLEKRKTLASVLKESEDDQQAGGAKLRLFDLLCIGIGTTIGSGVFVLTGKALTVAGPAAVLSWTLAGLICLLSSASYMELSARLPTKGSCYVFSYHALGELAGVVGAVCLTMEYGISGSGVARSWAAKLYKLIGSWWVVCYNGATAPAPGCNDDEDYYLDPVAALITVLSVLVIVRGLDMGKLVINSFTCAKVMLVLFMIVAGFSCWTGNMFESMEAFAPQGTSGVLSATSLLFFGFVGFDEVCCMASKTENPTKTMPRAMAGTLIGATLMSGVAQLALAAMVPYEAGMPGTPFEAAFSERGVKFASWLVHVGELVLLPLVVLLSILPQPELTAAMSQDGLLPSVFQSQRNGTYVRGTIILGALLTLISFGVPFAVLWDVISIGVLFSFNLTNAALINVRYGNGGSLKSPLFNWLVWLLMGLCCVSAYTLNLGVADPLFAGRSVSVVCLTIALVSGGAAALLALLIYFRFETQCDMADPAVFKAIGVPFVPATAMFFNFFLVSTLPFQSLGNFVIFLVAVVGVYMVYVCNKAEAEASPKPALEGGGAATDSVEDGQIPA